MTEKISTKKRKSFEQKIEDNIQNWEKKTSDNISKWEKKHLDVERKIEKTLVEVKEFAQQAEYLSKLCKDQMESFEDMLMHVMHNIKRNQFLYSHYPEEWVESYLSIKEGIKFENEFMEKKGAI